MNFNEYIEDQMNEALYVKYVVRGNKKTKKWKTTRPGKYRVEYDENGKPREVRITAAERRNRKLGQRKGKLKRAAKMDLIKRKQEKSFTARKNMGMAKYNKKRPDINVSRDGENPKKNLYASFKKLAAKTKDKLLAPKFEGYCGEFQNYLQESLLREWPEGIIWSDYTKGIDIGWDWCQEASENGEWLGQLISLYKFGYIETMRDDRNQPANEDGFISQPKIEFNQAQIEDITDTLCNDWAFLAAANSDIKLLKDKKLLADLIVYVPDRLWNKIVNYNKK